MTETRTLDGLPMDPRQALAHDEWLRLSQDGRTPLRQAFRPDRITRALPAAMLLHVERTENGDVQLRQQLEGRFVVLAFGEGAGRAFDSLYNDEHLNTMLPRYLEAAMTGDAAMTTCTAPRRNGEPFGFSRLILPFMGSDGQVNRLLAVFHFDPIGLARLSGTLNVRRETVTEFSLPVQPSTVVGFQARRVG